MSPRTSSKSGGAPAKKTTRSAAGAKPVKQIVDGKLAKSGKPVRAPRSRVPVDPDAAPRKRVRTTRTTTAVAVAAAPAAAVRKRASKVVPATTVQADGLPRRKRGKTLEQSEQLRLAVLNALEEMKARDVLALDVRDKTSITDWFVIVSGTSSRHVKSLADEVVKAAKALNLPPLGVEGEREGEWVVVDLADVVVHVMQPRTREFYALEKLWGVSEVAPEASLEAPEVPEH